MDIARLLLEYVQTLIWPIAFLVAVVMMRIPLAALLERLSSAEFLGLKTVFSNEIAELHRSVEAAETGHGFIKLPVADSPIEYGKNNNRVTAKRGSAGLIPPVPTFTKKTPGEVNVSLIMYIQQVIWQVRSRVLPNDTTALAAEPEELVRACNRLAAVTNMAMWAEASNVITVWSIFWATFGGRRLSGQLFRKQARKYAYNAAEGISRVGAFTLEKYEQDELQRDGNEGSVDEHAV